MAFAWAAAPAKAISHLSVQGLQVTPVRCVFKPDENATYEHFKALTEATGVPAIIYNVVPWNYLSPVLLVGLMTELPGVQGESGCCSGRLHCAVECRAVWGLHQDPRNPRGAAVFLERHLRR